MNLLFDLTKDVICLNIKLNKQNSVLYIFGTVLPAVIRNVHNHFSAKCDGTNKQV